MTQTSSPSHIDGFEIEKYDEENGILVIKVHEYLTKDDRQKKILAEKFAEMASKNNLVSVNAIER
jgi:hypothetical protein